jgi:VWFA-related protein
MRSRAAITAGAAVLAACACIHLTAQTPSQTAPSSTSNSSADQEPTLRLEVRRVPIDVVVLDKQGNPVKGLTAADFQIKEGNVVQEIKTFDTTDGSKPSYKPPKLPTLPVNTFVNVPDTEERGPLYILYFDMTNMAQDDQMSFHKELLKFVDEAQPGTRMMLILNTDRLHILQGFTTDHELIRQAILRKGPGPHVPEVFIYGDNYGRYDARSALGSLNWIAEYMSGLPGRKNLLWFSTDFPIPVSPTLVGSNQISQGGVPSNPGAGGGGPQVLDLVGLLADAMKSTYSNMMKSQIALYPIDVAGVSGALPKYDTMDMIAESTGGRAYYGSNHPQELIDKAVVHGETYYTLSYAPQKSDSDDSARHIQVKLVGNHPGFQLTYRTLYYAVPDDADDIDKQHKKDVVQARFLKAKAEDTLFANMEHGAPMVHDLLFSAHFAAEGSSHMASEKEMASLEDSPAFFRTRKPNKQLKPLPPVRLQKYRIDYGVIDPELRRLTSIPGTQPTIEFAVSAFNSEGATLNCMLNQATPSGAGASATGEKQTPLFRAEQELEVPEGAAYIRVAVRDMTTNRTGTLEAVLPLKPESGKHLAQK